MQLIEDAMKPQSGAGPLHSPLDMPSRNFFYGDVREIMIRPFNLLDLNAIHSSAKSGSLRMHVAAISRVLNVDATMLTPGDFDMCRYWERINSYPQRPYRIPWECDHEDHKRLAVLTEEELRAEFPEHPADQPWPNFGDFKNVVELTSKNLETLQLTDDDMREITDLINECHSEFGIWLYPETMMSLIEQSELVEVKLNNQKKRLQNLKPSEVDDLLEKLIDEGQDEFLSEIAGCINPVQDEGVALPTLASRIAWLTQRTEQDPAKFGSRFMDIVYRFREVSDHGVIEEVSDKCRRCGHQVRLTVELDVAHFFP